MGFPVETPELPPTEPRWKVILRRQGRTMTWLARETGKSQSTVYAYAYDQLTPPQEWLERVAEILGEPVS